ncbi:glucose 1-dehydrogenase [Aeromicrobium ponti]|uniref:3alpha(Or 20beta)-hydroxysteroid dehydrogenase n=1 Tax=Cytobacillus oceanisediminis TaxID=665099 RepID=A0A562K6Q3_9BACI|nr:SDR family NAD(P)-dependent oxidoreductase [Cytobacillus oceanisediminis]TWH90933.1 3alpha(or 20beta)-hydroxysteroid dehydrogenase [Cytobacillus oceanisediminis]
MRLADKVAVVTGATGGIGKAISEKFVKEGAQLLLVDLDQQRLEELKSELAPFGQKIEVAEADVSSKQSWEQILDKIDSEFSRVNVLVNNAGISGNEGLLETDYQRWTQIIQTNLTSVYLGMYELMPKMIESGGGSIINTSSIFAIIGSGKNAAYTAAKSGMMGLTKTAAVEFAKNYVRVNTIHPGMIRTPMTKAKLEKPEVLALFKSLTPWPEFGEPNDIAYGAVYLASDESKFVTGTELVIDGGYVTQ